MSEMLRKSQAVGLAPTDMTKQGLLDALVGFSKGAVIDGLPFDYHFMSICISELSNFMSQYDAALAGLLTDLFDCPPINEEKKRSGAGKTIPFPGISFIIGTATENLGNTITKDMWGSGFMARVIMVFSAQEVVPKNSFAKVEQNEALAEEISLGLRQIGELKGEMIWEPEAQERLNYMRHHQKEGAPVHNRLAHYVTRRWMHLGKLCMIAALNDCRMTVREEDYLQAYSWLQAAEAEMTEVFKDMISHEDGAIYEEMRSQMFQQHLKTRKPLPVQWIHRFLSTRVSSYSQARFIEVAEAAGYISRVAGTNGDDAMYIPSPPDGTSNPGVI